MSTNTIGPGGISCQCVSWSSSNDNLIATGNLSGSIYCHDIRSTQEPLLSHELHTNTVHRISFSPTLNGLVSTVSDDCTAKIFHFPSKSVMYVVCDYSLTFLFLLLAFLVPTFTKILSTGCRGNQALPPC